MIQDAMDRRNDQERRILLKTQDQQLVHRAVHGAGLSPWEAEVLAGISAAQGRLRRSSWQL